MVNAIQGQVCQKLKSVECCNMVKSVEIELQSLYMYVFEPLMSHMYDYLTLNFCQAVWYKWQLHKSEWFIIVLLFQLLVISFFSTQIELWL